MNARRVLLGIALLAVLLVAREAAPPARVAAQDASFLKLALACNDVAAPIRAGDELALVLAVSYGGFGTESGVKVVTSVPPELDYVAGSAQTNLGTLLDDGSTFTLTVPQLEDRYIVLLTYRAHVITGSEQFTATAVGRSAFWGPVTTTLTLSVAQPSRLYLPLILRQVAPESPEPLGIADAPGVCPGLPVTATLYRDDFDGENDNDWFTFSAQAGEAYRVETGDLGAQADTYLALYAADCVTLLAENDDIAYPGNIASRIVVTATKGAQYCVLVRNYDWRVYGPDTGYTLAVEPFDGEVPALQRRNVAKPTPVPTPAR